MGLKRLGQNPSSPGDCLYKDRAIANAVAAKMRLKEDHLIIGRLCGNIVFPFVQKRVRVSQGIIDTVLFLLLLSASCCLNGYISALRDLSLRSRLFESLNRLFKSFLQLNLTYSVKTV